MKKFLATITMATALLVPSVASAGWKVVQKDTRGTETMEATLYLENGKMRAETTGQPMVSIIDVKADKLMIIDHQKKVFGQKRLSEFVGEIKKMLDSVAMLKSQLPPEIAEQIPDPSTNFKMELKATGQEAVVAGYKASEFITIDGSGKESGTVWLSKDGKMGKLHGELMAITKAMGDGLGMLNPIIGMAQEKGFPVKSHLLQGDGYVDSEITSIKEQALGAGSFNVPPAYKSVEFNSFFPAPTPNVTTVNPGK